MENSLESTVFEGLSHPVRRRILKVLSVSQGITYTQLLSDARISTGRLNYHLNYLAGFIEKPQDGQYHLTPLGRLAVDLLDSLNQRPVNGITEYLQLARTPALNPAIRFTTKVAIAVLAYINFWIAISAPAFNVFGYQFFGPVVWITTLGSGVALMGGLIYSLSYPPKVFQRLDAYLY